MSGEKRLQLLAQNILRHFFKNNNAAVDIALVDVKKMRALNRAFRGLDRATNVLSFTTPANFPSVPRESKFLGEIYLCPSIVKTRGENIDYLLVHGLLHLLGFDHTKERAKMRMVRLEREILTWLKNRS